MGHASAPVFFALSFILHGGSIDIYRRIHTVYIPSPFFWHVFVFHPSRWKHWHISTHSHCLHPVSFFLACLCLPSFTVEAWTYLLHSHMHSHYRYQYSQNSVSCRVFSVAAS